MLGLVLMIAEKVYETIKVFTPDMESGVMYGNSVGDYNIIHRDDKEAIRLGGKLGLERAIAAGMGVIARAQGSEKIKVANFKFKGFVYYDQDVAMQREVGGNGYRFIDNDSDPNKPTIFCEGEIRPGEPSGNIVSLPQRGLIYDEMFHVSKKDVKNYLSAAGKSNEEIRSIDAPDLLMMSLPAAAMVNHAKKNGKGGFHNRQSMEIHLPWELGDVNVSLFQKKFRVGSAFQKYQVYWSQKDLVVASGEAIIVPFDLE